MMDRCQDLRGRQANASTRVAFLSISAGGAITGEKPPRARAQRGGTRHGNCAVVEKVAFHTSFFFRASAMGDQPSTSSFAGVYLLVSRATPASQRTYVG